MSVALPAEPTERYVKALAELQDVLGELNDAAVARSSLKAASRHESVLDFVDHWLERCEVNAAHSARRRLLLLSEMPLSWRSQ
jgi:CHAD domain-containing protein